MTKKEAVLGKAVWLREDIGHIKEIAKMPVIHEIGIKFIDKLTGEYNKRQTLVAINGVLEEIKDMKHDEHYLNQVRKSFAKIMKEKRMDCKKDIIPAVNSITDTWLKCNLAIDLAPHFRKYADSETQDVLRSFFDKSGGLRGFTARN